jgi:hypothetical protein
MGAGRRVFPITDNQKLAPKVQHNPAQWQRLGEIEKMNRQQKTMVNDKL